MSISFLQRLQRHSRSQGGFTLVEMGIVFLIAGLILTPVYLLLMNVTKLEPDEVRMVRVKDALAEHLRITGTLPCPADLSLDLDSGLDVRDGAAGTAVPNGIEDAYEAGNCAAIPGGVFVSVPGAPPATQVIIGALPIANLRAAIGCYDRNPATLTGVTTDIVGAVKEQMYSAREVLMGQDAIIDYDGDTVADAGTRRVEDTRCLSWDYAMDEHGSKIVYAVSFVATQPGFDVFDPTTGQIYIRDGNAAANILHDPTAVPATGQVFVLVSHGPDQKGAFLRDGTRGPACGVEFGLDNENCDFAIGGVPTTPGAMPGAIGGIPSPKLFASTLYTDLVGGQHFDDHIEYGMANLVSEDTFWRWGSVDAAGTARHMHLNSNARIVIDADDSVTTNPDDAVVVNRGRMRVNGRLEIDSAGTSTGGSVVTENGDIEVDSRTNSRDSVTSPVYCYPTALSSGGAC